MSFVDSICVRFLDPYLIIYGKGNQLLLHCTETKTLDGIQPTREKIHKISHSQCDTNEYRIVCSAGREIFVTKVKNGKFQRDFMLKTKFSDWIMDICYLRCKSIAIITAHNVALLLEIEGSQLTVKQKLRCEDNSTLYCSHIHGNAWHNLIFFSGTALGELIIWKGTHAGGDQRRTIFQRSLHNGVIFSIHYSEGVIVTSSDDRSIKIFKPNNDLSELHEQKQLFGHTSRVFVGRVINYNGSTMYVSAGEDGSVCVWNVDGTLQTKNNVGASGGIWNLDYDQATATIVTSSATGKLNRFSLNKIFCEHHSSEAISASDPTKLIYLGNGTLCVLDSDMQIFTKSLTPGSKWIKVDQLPHKIVAIDAYENRLFLIAKNSISIFDFDDDDADGNGTGKLNFSSFELNIVERFSLPNETDFYFRALHVLSKSTVFISDMHGYCFVVDVERVALTNLFKVPKCSEAWTTAAVRFNDNFWIVGDRVGSLLLYRNSQDLTAFHQPIQRISKLHSQFGVTSIRLMDNGFFKTTGIGGTIKTLRVNRSTESIELYQTEKTPIVSVQTIRSYNGSEYMHGFNDNYFVVCKRNEIIYEHRCGGKHRHWDVAQINRSEGGGGEDCKLRFTYINKKLIHSVEFYANDFVFNTAAAVTDDNVFWHLKGCNVIKMIDDAMILISAGEDTFLKLTQIEMMENDVSFRSVANVNSHISSIKALATFSRGDDLLIISAGGRAQIVLTRVINMKYVKEEINFMLAEVNGRRGVQEERNSTFDPETCFTCLHFDQNESILFVGCSDGFIRVYKLLEKNGAFTSLQLMIESYYGRCILRITAIGNLVLSMATDGVVCFWALADIQREMSIVAKLQHNQNGINGFDVLTCGNSHKIATAGDDGGIYVTEFEQLLDDGADCIKFHKTVKSYEVHTAQVAGVKFLSRDEILTASIDQTVCKLKIRDDKFEILDKKHTCIADVKGVAIYDKKFILIHGAGLEKLDYF